MHSAKCHSIMQLLVWFVAVDTQDKYATFIMVFPRIVDRARIIDPSILFRTPTCFTTIPTEFSDSCSRCNMDTYTCTLKEGKKRKMEAQKLDADLPVVESQTQVAHVHKVTWLLKWFLVQRCEPAWTSQ